MSHEIEADFVLDWENEASSCCRCTSFHILEDGSFFCSEAQAAVPENAHCDFFQSAD